MNRNSSRRRAHCSILTAILAGLTVALLLSQRTGAQQGHTEDPLLAQALEQLAEDVGVWQSRWEMLSPQGEVVQEVEGTETGRYLLGERVVEITTEIPAVGHVSKSWRFFNPITKRIEFSSVDQRGVHWFMHAEVGSDVMTSDPHTRPDGSQMLIRFVVVEEKEDWMLVHREDSFDDGKTWRLGARQYRTRAEE